MTAIAASIQGYIDRSRARRDYVQTTLNEQMIAKASKIGGAVGDSAGKVASRSLGGPGVGDVAKKGKISLNELMSRIAAKESGGNYSAVGDWNSGDRAYGKYQIMGNNIPSWTQQYLGKSLTPQQFLNRKKAQDKVAAGKLAYYYKRYGPGGAAASWYAGESAAEGWKDYKKSNYSDNGTEYPSVYEYVRDILRG